MEVQEIWELKVHQDNQVTQASKEKEDQKVFLDHQEKWDPQDPKEMRESVDREGQWENLAHLDPLGREERLDK